MDEERTHPGKSADDGPSAAASSFQATQIQLEGIFHPYFTSTPPPKITSDLRPEGSKVFVFNHLCLHKLPHRCFKETLSSS